MHIDRKDGFFFSSLTQNNPFQKMEEFREWYNKKLKTGHFVVKEIPFNSFDQWAFADNNFVLKHHSGKFFKIEGIQVKTNFGTTRQWEQPIINQPEIGILGILTKVFNGTRYFLMQLKMEPGNVNILQLSPTVQATKSNFSQVHKGKLPSYLEYFIDRSKSKIVIDQLQTEQGGRFLKKRNRNMIVEITDDIELLDDFCWLTLGEIKSLLRIDNFVNMDARSVISTIPLIDDNVFLLLQDKLDFQQEACSINELSISGFNFDLLVSICSSDKGFLTKDQVISWYTQQKVDYELEVKQIPLSELKDWKITENAIVYNENFFSVIGVKVEAGTREVSSWTQPLIKDLNIGLLGFVVKKINGVLHFLVQAKVEPGNIDVIELSPSVSCSNYKNIVNKQIKPLFIEYFIGAGNSKVHFDTLQSEEGGRFYHLQNRNMIVEVDENEILEIPSNYVWMTLNQMMDFMKYSMFNIEARSLVSCLTFIQE
jgi:oxidase EvaA